ncbi:DnaJ C-terminal domain-containing protein [Hydrogenophaga sp. BPS33]|uniref:DnaJ C-terminal domain-containing protein n=1 Tax=Hydrogenophaga sp. BPS33 TaxID=2651974 RepID=UPI0013203F3F|nr:DnaJ C-terminal domain-containing protein [Hydrogenophaga sp. BPS33]QHE86253.1 DnaJ domain-containing protein [Hydrogenophaga sp. BPS33]
MEFKDYYKVLGSAHDASAEDIKKAYRKLARKYHPDVSKVPDAAERMSELNEAYAVLSDIEKRAAYDAIGQGRQAGESFTPPPGWDEGFEFSGSGSTMGSGDRSAFFEELFGRMGRQARQPPRGEQGADHFRARGEDHHASILLDIEEAWQGVRRVISLRSPTIDAEGHLRLVERTLEVTIPPGVKAGQLIRLAGQGSAGFGGGAPGDLLLEVRLRPHARFQVDGADLIVALPLAPWEAALGAVVPVSLPDGRVLKVRVPAGTKNGQVITVRGRGLPAKQPGDLDLHVGVILPSAHDPRVRELYEQMANALPDFDARKQHVAEQAPVAKGGAR